MTKTVIGLYDNHAQAQAVVQALIDAGFDRKEIGILKYDPERRYVVETGTAAAEGAAGGAVSGGVVGGAIGLLVGVGTFAIPGLGPVVAAGPIAATLTGATVGAVSGGVLGALVGWGVPEEHVEYYAEGLRRGATLVSAKVAEARADEAARIMDRHNPVDLEERAAAWRAEGWTGYDVDLEPVEDMAAPRDPHERYRADFERHHRFYYADSGQGYDYYDPAYRYGVTAASEEAYRDRDWHHVEPELRAEWKRDHDESTWEEIRDAVRYGWDRVTGVFDDDDYRRYQSHFKRHYQNYFADTGWEYAYYEPGYMYGYTLGRDYRYDYVDWDLVEPTLSTHWQQNYKGLATWHEMKDAVRYGWRHVKSDFDDDYETHRSAFSDHHRTHYGSTRRDFDKYEAAYRYGARLGTDLRYQERAWEEIEPTLKTRWEEHERHQSPWEEVREAVRYGWQRVRQTFSGYSDHRAAFETHCHTTYGAAKDDFAYYEPAYRYGYNMGLNPDYLRREWDQVESELRRKWETRYSDRHDTWHEVKAAIRYAWSRAKEAIQAGRGSDRREGEKVES